jgi:hypothetical protein
MTKLYKIKVVKETFVDLRNEDEAKQVADLLLGREDTSNFAGHTTIAYSDYEIMEVSYA